MRKKRSLLNLIWSIVSFAFIIIFKFITQAAIVKILGIEYSGINGLFANIITLLSVAELGIGTTIIYKLYKPLSENNKEAIKSWLNFYKICYRYVALFVGIIGIVIIPFVPLIVGKTTIKESIMLLYVISLLDVLFSYVMTYKRSLLLADQKNYVINIVHIIYTILMSLSQIIILITTSNYILFLIDKVFFRLLENILINIYVNKNYPYVIDKSSNISKEEKKDVFERIKAIFLQKISFVINKGIDGIVITSILGIKTTGYYTSYHTIVLTICQFAYEITSSILGSVGNLLTENNPKKNYSVYKKINFFNSYIVGIFIISFIGSVQSFIEFWIGEEYLLSNVIVLSFGLYIYSDSIRRSITLYKEAAGICKEDKHMYILMAFINLVSSIFLCYCIGMSGVILGTVLSYLFLIIFSYPKYVFKPLFNKSVVEYYIENGKYLIYIIISSSLSFLVGRLILLNNPLISFIVDGFLSVLIGTTIFIIMFFRTEEFHYYRDLITRFLKKIIL